VIEKNCRFGPPLASSDILSICVDIVRRGLSLGYVSFRQIRTDEGGEPQGFERSGHGTHWREGGNRCTGVDQKASDAELIALLCKTEAEIDVHGELNESNLLLNDFARELLKQRLQL